MRQWPGKRIRRNWPRKWRWRECCHFGVNVGIDVAADGDDYCVVDG